MTKYEFLAQLEAALSALDNDERKEALRYYEEYFEDSENTADSLRSPQEIADELLASYGISDPAENADPKAPLLKALAVIALWFLVLVLGSTALGLICASAVIFVIAFFLISFSVPISVVIFGAAILVLGLFGLALGGTIKSVNAAVRSTRSLKGGNEK